MLPEHREELQEKMREYVKQSQFPPSDDAREYDTTKINCYRFALGIPYFEDYDRDCCMPGCISDIYAPPIVFDRLTERVMADLDFLGLSYREVDTNLRDKLVPGIDEYFIAIYTENSEPNCPINFHMFRLTKRGLWCAKAGWNRVFLYVNKLPDLTINKLHLESILAISRRMPQKETG